MYPCHAETHETHETHAAIAENRPQAVAAIFSVLPPNGYLDYPGLITVEFKDENGNAASNGAGSATINLSSNMPGAFRNLEDTADIEVVTIPIGASSAVFRYRPAETGVHELTASDADGVLTPDTRELKVGRLPFPAQTYYLPMPEDRLNQALQTMGREKPLNPEEQGEPLNQEPLTPVRVYGVITTVNANTIIYYDHMEDGHERDLRNLTSIYHPENNPSGTQIWGDGDPSNGHPPGMPDDIIPGGATIMLANSLRVLESPDPAHPQFRAGDRIAATKAITVTWAAGSPPGGPFPAGANEVYDVSHWGTEYVVPVGEDLFTDMPGAAGRMFEYAGAAVMAGPGGAEVQIDLDGNGIIDHKLELGEGETHLVDGGLAVGGRMVSDKPVQVDLITGQRRANGEGRFFRLLPTRLWAAGYATPVTTPESVKMEIPDQSTESADPEVGLPPESAHEITGAETMIWLYNPGASAIEVTCRQRDPDADAGARAEPIADPNATIDADGDGDANDDLLISVIQVPAGGYARHTLADGSGAHFHTKDNAVFYALSTTTSTRAADAASGALDTPGASEGPGTPDAPDAPDHSRIWDWGFALTPDTLLTSQVLVGLGTAQDPASPIHPDENHTPVWVTALCGDNDRCDADTPITIYVDFQDPKPGPFTDPNGFPYDRSYTIRELEQIKVYNPSGDQTGMLIYTFTKGVKLAAAWGPEPSSVSLEHHGLSMGTAILPLPKILTPKHAILWADGDDDGFISPGDDLQYEIRLANNTRMPIEDIAIEDTLPDSVDYLENTTTFTDHELVTIPIEDDVVPDAKTAFPLDEGGIILPRPALPPGQDWQVNYRVRIKPYDELPPGVSSVVNAMALAGLAALVAVEPFHGRIGSRVWLDENENGIYDDNEKGLMGIKVRLYDGMGDLLAETLTDRDGQYQFAGLRSREYQVEFVIPPEKKGLAFTQRNADGLGLRSPVNSDADPTTGRTDLFMLMAGEPLVQVDAGLYGTIAPAFVLPFVITAYTAAIAAVDTPSTITTTLRIENTGIAPLTGITINSPFLESLNGPGHEDHDAPAPDGALRMEQSEDGETWTIASDPTPEGDPAPEAVLDVGETWIFTGAFAVTQEMIDGNGVDTKNRIDGNGFIDSALIVSFAGTEPQTAVASIAVIQNPDFTVIQIADMAVIDAPKTINYTITIENTGNLSLTGISITAPLMGDLEGPEGDIENPGVLDVGEVWTYTGAYAATREVIDGAGVTTYNIINNSGNIESTVMVNSAEMDIPQTAYAAVATKLTITGDIFEKKYRHLHAFVSAKRSYTTNLYRTDNNPESCWSTFITPGVWATYPSEMKRSVEIVTANASPGGLAIEPFNPVDFNRFQAYILYSPQFERYHGQKNRAYQDPDTGAGIIDDDDVDRADDAVDDFFGNNNSLNRTTHRVDAMLHYHSGNMLSLRAIDQYKINYDPFSERAYFTDDKYESNMFHIAGTLDPTAKLQARLDYSNFRLNYRDDFNLDDDRRDDTYAAYLFFRLTAKTSVFLNYEYADISYKTSARDSYEHRYYGGIRWEITGKSSGQIKGGYGKKRMDSPGMIDTDVAITDITGDNWLAAIQFDHNFTERINLTFNAYRRFDEVLEHRYNYGNLDNFYADYIRASFGGFKLSWKPIDRLSLTLDTSLFHDRFKGSRLMDRDGNRAERRDLDLAISPSLSIDLFKYLNIKGAYIYTDHDSNYPAHDYVDHTFFISASLSI